MSNANDDKSPLIDLLTCIATDRGYPGLAPLRGAHLLAVINFA